MGVVAQERLDRKDLTMNQIIALVFAVAAISYTITSTRIFREPRDWVVRKTFNYAADEKSYVGEWISCPYCFSHWVSFILAFAYHVRLVNCGQPIVDFFISAFALVMPANVLIQLFRMLGRFANNLHSSTPIQKKEAVSVRD